jgi:hypothetical protein
MARTSGGGATQLCFCSNSKRFNRQQLSQIRFDLSGAIYPATILSNVEVMPVTPGGIHHALFHYSTTPSVSLPEKKRQSFD